MNKHQIKGSWGGGHRKRLNKKMKYLEILIYSRGKKKTWKRKKNPAKEEYWWRIYSLYIHGIYAWLLIRHPRRPSMLDGFCKWHTGSQAYTYMCAMMMMCACAYCYGEMHGKCIAFRRSSSHHLLQPLCTGQEEKFQGLMGSFDLAQNKQRRKLGQRWEDV